MKKSARQYKALLATIRPRDLAGKTCRRMAAEELEDPGRLDVKLKALKAELKAAVLATGSHLTGHPRDRARRSGPDPGRRRRRHPLPGPRPLCFLERYRPDRRLQRAAHPAPALPRGEPPDQPRALHGRDRPAPQRHSRPRLLPAQTRGGENLHGSDARPAAAPVRRRLPSARHRRRCPPGHITADGPGRALRGGSVIQRGRPSPGHRHFGPATSRARTPDATPTADSPEDPRGPHSCHITTARQRCQRGAPHWTNDVDTDQHRRTLDSSGDPGTAHLTNSVIEGSHERKAQSDRDHDLSGQLRQERAQNGRAFGSFLNTSRSSQSASSWTRSPTVRHGTIISATARSCPPTATFSNCRPGSRCQWELRVQ